MTLPEINYSFGLAVFMLLSADINNLRLLLVRHFALHEQENMSEYEERKELHLLIWHLVLFKMWSWISVPEPPTVLVINTDSWAPSLIH